MKWKTFNPAVIALLVIVSSLFISNSEIYLVTCLMALAIMRVIHRHSSGVLKITRWAKANPQKSQWIITGLQLVIMVMGIIAGKNFKELGYDLPVTAVYVFSVIMAIGFFSVHFWPTKSIIAIPKVVNRHRSAYMGIAISSFALTMLIGNRIGDFFPGSPITQAIEAIDRAFMQEENIGFAGHDDLVSERESFKNVGKVLSNEPTSMVTFASIPINDKEEVISNGKEEITSNGREEINPDDEIEMVPGGKEEITTDNENEIIPPTDLKKDVKANFRAEKKMKKFEKKKARLIHRLEKRRLALAAALTGGAVLLIILLVLLACTGVCLVIGGIALIADGSFGGILAILAGIGLGWLSIREIGRVSKRDRERTEAKEKADEKAKEKL